MPAYNQEQILFQPQLVRDHHARSSALLLEQQALCGLRVAAALDQDVEHHPMLVHGSPQPMLPARKADHDLIEVPLVPERGQMPPDLGGGDPRPNFSAYCRTVSWLTAMPLAASISSSMRRLKGNRK